MYHKKTRDAEGLFIAEGPKLVNEIIHSNIEIKNIYALHDWARHAGAEDVTIISESELQKISCLQTPNHVLAVAVKPPMEQEPELKGRLSIVLDGIQDPGNMGTIIRIADWFGIYQVIASADTADHYNPKVVQATMGSLLRVKVWHKNLHAWLAHTPIKIYGAMLNGNDVYKTGTITEGLLVIGSEGRGIRPGVAPYINHALTIPGNGNAESLNAAVAMGIILSRIVSG